MLLPSCRYLLAVGLESGAISLYSCHPTMLGDDADSPVCWSPLLSLPPSLAHTSTVKRLQWRPVPGGRLDRQLQGSSTDQRDAGQTAGEGDGVTDAVHHLELVLASCSTDHTVKLYSIVSK